MTTKTSTRSNRELFLFLSIIAVFYVIVQLELVKPSSTLTQSTTNELKLSTSIVKQNKSNKKKNSCVSLSLDSDNNDEKEENERGIISLESLLRNDDGILHQVFITMPAKAAGTSMKEFTFACMKHVGSDFQNSDNHSNPLNTRRKHTQMDFLYDEFSHKNTILTSHLLDQDSLPNLIQNMPYSTKKTDRGSLLIYIHRGETDRLVSAIRFVLSETVCVKERSKIRPWAQKIFDASNKLSWREKLNPYKQQNKTHCILNEEDVVDMIKQKPEEIGFSANKLLNCKTYETLKENNPLSYFDDDDDDESFVSGGGVLFIDYTQVDKLQKVLEKHHCPGMLSSSMESNSNAGSAIHANVAGSSSSMQVVMLRRRRNDPNNNNEKEHLVSLNDWLGEKRMSLEWTLDLKGSSSASIEASCQTTTRRIEKKMYQCPDETMILPNSLL